MLNIPEFPLPSNPKTKISFRAPDVSDCMLIADQNPHLEESATTLYLNTLQDLKKQGSLNDSAFWTGEDRRTALWWIFINSNEDTTVSYRFSENEEDVYLDLNLVDLGDTAVTLSRKPSVPIEFDYADEVVKAEVVPLNGQSLEAIELTRLERGQHEKESIEYKQLTSKISMQQLIYSLRIKGEPDDPDDAADKRYSIISKLKIGTEYRSLMAKVHQAKKLLVHGLATTYHDGVYLLVVERELKEGEGVRPLMFPFQCDHFIQTL
ncbi:hypothetical protein L4174_023800 (plasmid) [Photobacterium sp. CCB-ST2H9]|uniref:hypothetical protein n=1 Tax=Photobacterium sp. CCB-ST2H9 TaxID=2912855 RepID=UPI0020064058|nr:hypothetical protein [Photobacterium sp. CCB-ST2H9]UTM60411.1 hypothetical protein L4174_023800 [Photobacterium sp. CCB-ST2H9]